MLLSVARGSQTEKTNSSPSHLPSAQFHGVYSLSFSSAAFVSKEPFSVQSMTSETCSIQMKRESERVKMRERKNVPLNASHAFENLASPPRLFFWATLFLFSELCQRERAMPFFLCRHYPLCASQRCVRLSHEQRTYMTTKQMFVRYIKRNSDSCTTVIYPLNCLSHSYKNNAQYRSVV